MQMLHALPLSGGQFSVLVRQGALLFPVLSILIVIICTCAGTKLHIQLHLAFALGHDFIFACIFIGFLQC